MSVNGKNLKVIQWHKDFKHWGQSVAHKFRLPKKYSFSTEKHISNYLKEFKLKFWVRKFSSFFWQASLHFSIIFFALQCFSFVGNCGNKKKVSLADKEEVCQVYQQTSKDSAWIGSLIRASKIHVIKSILKLSLQIFQCVSYVVVKL